MYFEKSQGVSHETLIFPRFLAQSGHGYCAPASGYLKIVWTAIVV